MTKNGSNKKKNILLSIVVILFGVLLVGGTYAFLILVLNVTNGNYAAGTQCFDVIYDVTNDDGTMDLTGVLEPSDTYIDGLSGQVSIVMKEGCNVRATGNIYLNVESKSILTQIVSPHCENTETLETLSQYRTEESCVTQSNTKWVTDGSALKYVVFESNYADAVSMGYVNDSSMVELYSNFDVSTLTKYNIYLWLDGNLIDNTYENVSFNANISAEVVQVNNPAHPVLDPGMIPVTIANDGTVRTVSETDGAWYDYNNQKWANVVLVDETNRSNYLDNLGSNMIVNQEDILAYYVWIPRYKYKMKQSKCSDIDSPTIENNPECYVDGETFNGNISYITKDASIDIIFEEQNDKMFLGNAATNYRTHPAFWWDNDNDGFVDDGEMLSGIWVGKFESTPDKDSACYVTPNETNCNNSTQNATVLPNISSLRYQNVSNQFMTSQNFTKSGNVYGLSNSNINAHMMKNSEWGAVAYLSHSEYGINEEISMNNNSYYKTGCGSTSTSTTDECQNAYKNVTSYPQSATGNISGIFDMSGGAWERVMGNYAKVLAGSGFSSMPKTKYYDLYSQTQFSGTTDEKIASCTLGTCGGHALNETFGWYSDSRGFFIESVCPWFLRGGGYFNKENSGAFAFHYDTGGLYESLTWRSVLVPGFGL